jgi:uncharacterized protein YkwD
MPFLVLQSDGGETRYELTGRVVTVGRSTECDIQVSEERASRKHFQVESTDRGWAVRDLESSNGTAVNGYAVSRALLTNGDLIEVEGLAFRFETDGGAAPARAKRPERPKPSAGPAWLGALTIALAVAVVTDILAVESARARDREIRTVLEKTAHAEYLLATREADPDAAEQALRAYLMAHPSGGDASQARTRLAGLIDGRQVRAKAGADFEDLRAAAPGLAAPEYRWRLDRLVRRWADSPEGLDEIRRRAADLRAPAEAKEDARVLFQRRRQEARAAMQAGEFGRALALWTVHAIECPPADASADADLRAEFRAVEEAAAARAEDLLARFAALRDEGKGEEGLRVLREALPSLGATGAGRRIAARLEFGAGTGRGPGGAPSAAEAKEGAEGFALKREFYLRAREAEQFVALRDYRSAADLYAGIASSASAFPVVKGEMETRALWLRRVADLLDSLRAPGLTWRGKPWPESWGEVPPEDLASSLGRAAKRPEDRLALAVFAYDQGLLKEAREAVAAALAEDSTRDEAERLYATREGLAIPEGGFVAEKGEIVTKGEWLRRRNAEAIAKVRDRQKGLVRRLHETQIVRSLDRLRALRAELDKARAHALELIFDEAAYFYPYQDRMGEYTPVQMEVDRRVEAVRRIWEDKTRLRTKADSGTLQILRDYDLAEKEARALGGEPGSLERDVERVRLYLDRDLDVRTYFTDAADLEGIEYSAGVMRENLARKAVADESEARQVEVTNEYRVMFGRRAVLLADKLVLSARAHGDDMSRGGFFAHENRRLLDMKPGEKVPKQACGCSSDGLIPGCGHGPDGRIRNQGYEFVACGENIHMGSGDPEGAHRGWCHSSGHHRNILQSAWKEMGTGRVGRYWTQNFALPLVRDTTGAGSDPWDGGGGTPPGGR